MEDTKQLMIINWLFVKKSDAFVDMRNKECSERRHKKVEDATCRDKRAGFCAKRSHLI